MEPSPQELIEAVAKMADVARHRVELTYSWVDGEFLVCAVVYLMETTGRGASKRPKTLVPRGATGDELLLDLAEELAKRKGVQP
jgi:hypothetical protein